MSILINSQTKVLVQGITGREGRSRARLMKDYGTNVVAGVTPGRGGDVVEGIPVFNSVEDAVKNCGTIDASVLFIRGPEVKGAAIEAIKASVKLLVLVADRMPLWDILEIIRISREYGANFLGPNTLGVCSPGQGILGMVGGRAESARAWFKKGPVGIVSRSGGITSSIAYYLGRSGIGISTLVHVGGEPVIGLSLPEIVLMFEQDPETSAIVLFGEIGGTQEERVADLIIEGKIKKPVIAFVGGKSAKSGTRFSHAGAIIEGGRGTHEGKVVRLRDAGAVVVDSFDELPRSTLEVLRKRGIKFQGEKVPSWKTAVTSIKPNEVRVRGYRIDELMGKISFGAAVYLVIRGELPDKNVARLMEAMLVSSIDHGVTPPSALAARNAASTGSALNAALSAGALSINRHHGGAIEGCMEVLIDAVELVRKGKTHSEAALEVANRIKVQGERVPGFGHRIHTADPRTLKLLQLAEHAGLFGDYMKTAMEIEKILGTDRNVPLNVDGVIGACLCELGFSPVAANAVFIIARMAGLTAQYLEERTRERPMRQISQNDWGYDGQEPRTLPDEWK
jgi:succinyl-CoA synthetase alpha subunit